MRHSKQREQILNSIQCKLDHPTANEVYHSVREVIPNISLGTVYRNLNSLVKDGKITSFMGMDGKEQFDKRLDNHFHMICSKCHSTYDIDIDYDFQSNLWQEKQFELLNVKLLLEGICHNCQK